MRKTLKDKNGRILDLEISGYDLINPLEYIVHGFNWEIDAWHIRVNKKRWRTNKEVDSKPYMSKKKPKTS